MRLLALIACAGCNQLLGIDRTKPRTPDAAIDAVGCAGVQFAGPTPLSGFDGDLDGQWGALELWFDRLGTTTNYDLYRVTRTSVDVPFDPANMVEATELDSSSADEDPSITLDGLDLIFSSPRSGAPYDQAWEATRTDTSQPFGNLHVVNEASDKQINEGHDLSWDGLWLFYVDANEDLRALYRARRADPFGPPSDVLASGVTWPSVSPDLHEVFYVPAGGSGVYRRTRADVTGPFDSTPELIAAGADDPDISNDSTVLVMEITGRLSVMTRMCP